MAAIESFSADYGQARMKFVEAAKAQGGELQRIAHPARGPDGADLSMDIAWLGDRSASKVLVTFSGVHGVEGFFGSGVQTEWLRRNENRRVPQDTAALLVHAVNPYGFAWLRRTNEDNVDLNRNWIDFDRPLPANERYKEMRRISVHPTGRPRRRRRPAAALSTGGSAMASASSCRRSWEDNGATPMVCPTVECRPELVPQGSDGRPEVLPRPRGPHCNRRLPYGARPARLCRADHPPKAR